MILLKEKSESKDSIQFKFGDNTFELYRNPLGPIYLRTGEQDDLCLKINGFRKVLNKIRFNEDSIEMTFHHE